MNDERAVEVMAEGYVRMAPVRSKTPADVMREILAALRAEGFDLYRPDDCVPVYRTSVIAGTYAVTLEMDEADGLVVPVGGEG